MRKINKFVMFGFFLLMSATLFAQDDMGSLGKIDYLYLARTSIVMMALVLVSIVSLAAVVERYIFFRKIRFNSKKTMKHVEKYIKEGDYAAVEKYCAKNNPLNNVIKAILENKEKDKADLEAIYEIMRSQEKENMERFMMVLSSATAVSPLLGLLGTVTGIIKAFSDLAAAGTGGPSIIAAGVSEALVTTAFGLFIAIPVLIIFNFFNNKIRVILEELDVNIRILFFSIDKR